MRLRPAPGVELGLVADADAVEFSEVGGVQENAAADVRAEQAKRERQHRRAAQPVEKIRHGHRFVEVGHGFADPDKRCPHRRGARTVAADQDPFGHDDEQERGHAVETAGGGEGATPEREDAARHVAREYMATDGSQIHWDMIRLALMSVADLAIVPVQDLLGLGSEARMNLPGAPKDNWAWRLREGALDRGILGRFAHLTRLYGR